MRMLINNARFAIQNAWLVISFPPLAQVAVRYKIKLLIHGNAFARMTTMLTWMTIANPVLINV